MTNALDHFNALYESSVDPWHVASSWFERRKADILLAMLPRDRYAYVFEPACGVGMLSQLLAARSDRLLAVDFSPKAVEETRRRLRNFPGAQARLLDVPTEWPEISFDLIVISEYAYYLSPEDLALLLQKLRAAHVGADIICCSSTIEFDDRMIGAAELSQKLQEALGPFDARYADDRFETQLWTSANGMPLPSNTGEIS